ncbi:hypothetical protein F3Y22_tig00003041pilonHSYRG00903 [Hibiscus syriacus]|uniref:Uncharacterized protein n=1 Tax=Hibiscus syriacus TaxID=106335 RepID=A0A6A3CRG9_HIBSY|nr:hypothetical protein F3Y22_tig00003041pilonHSYRG00903 [Hibiscus syriacus]
METTKKKGLFGTLLTKSLSRVTAAKPRATTAHHQSSKVVPYSFASSNQPTGSYEHTGVPNRIPLSTQRVSSYTSFDSPSSYDQINGFANKTWGPADENVDLKAARFISNVRERRFKLDRVD